MRHAMGAQDLPEALAAAATPGFVLAASAGAVSGAADTNENILATVTIPAGVMGRNGILRVTTVWTHTNSANNKTMRVRLGGIAGTAHAAIVDTTTATLVDERCIYNRGAQNSQVSGPAATGFGAAAGAVVTGAVDTSAETTLVITGQKASGGETLTLEAWMVEIRPRA